MFTLPRLTQLAQLVLVQRCYLKLYQHERQINMSKNDLNNISRTNWEALKSMSDDDIDYSDIPPLTDEFFEKATLRVPATQAQNLIQLGFKPKVSNTKHSLIQSYANTSKIVMTSNLPNP